MMIDTSCEGRKVDLKKLKLPPLGEKYPGQRTSKGCFDLNGMLQRSFHQIQNTFNSCHIFLPRQKILPAISRP